MECDLELNSLQPGSIAESARNRSDNGLALEPVLAQMACPALIARQDGIIRWCNGIVRERLGVDEAAIASGRVSLRFDGIAILSGGEEGVSRAECLTCSPVGDGSGDIVGIGADAGTTRLACRIDTGGKVQGLSAELGALLRWNTEDGSSRPLESVFEAEDWPRVRAAVDGAVEAESGECVVSARLVTPVAANLHAEVRITVPDRENAMLGRLFEATPDALSVLEVDREGLWRHKKVNEAFRKAVGLTSEEVLHRTPEEVFGGTYGAAVSRACECSAVAGKRFEVGDGSTQGARVRWNSLIVPFSDGEGRANEVVMLSRDVTARVAREERLRLREEMLESLLQLQAELISRTTRDGRFLFANEACCRFLGRTLKELQGERWDGSLVEEDVEVVRGVRGRLRPEAPIGVAECRRYNAAGEVRWMDYQFVGVFDGKGELVEVIAAGRDVTVRKQMEARLAEVTAELQETIELTPGLLFHFGADGGLISVRGACEQILGYRAEECGGGLADWMEEGAMAGLVEGGPAVHFRHTVRSNDGREVWLDSSARLLDGEVRAASIEVTDRVIAEQKLEAERRFLGTLFATMSQGVVYQNSAGDVERANPAAEGILGLTMEQMLGRNSVDPRWGGIHEDGSPWPGEEHPSMVALRSGHAVVDALMGVYNPAEGRRRWLRINAIPRYEAGETKASGVYTVFSDVTRMREAQAALEEKETILRMALEASNTALWCWDTGVNTGFVSPLYPEILGLGPADMEQWERKLFDYVHPDDAAAVRSELDKCLRGEKQSFNLIHRMLHRSGRVVWVSANGVVMDKGPRGSSAMMAGTIRDISELVEARRVAEKFAERRRAFLANMSHEIRTPMNGIMGLAELLGSTELSQEQRQLLENIQRSGSSLLALVNDILDLSKIEAGKISMERIEFELAALAEEALETVETHAASKGLKVELTVADSLPLAAVGDPNRLRQVMVNLLSNAVKFTAAGTVRMELGGEASAGRVRVSVKVSDTGIGMTAEQRGKLFRAFEQAERSTTRLFGGSGLGLSISKQLVELMGGEIGAVSEVGVGSTFQFTVILETAARREAECPAGRGVRVLVVADEEWERCLRVRQLERFGHTDARDACCDVVLAVPSSVRAMEGCMERLEEDELLREKPLLLITPFDWRPGRMERGWRTKEPRLLSRPLTSLALAEAVDLEGRGEARRGSVPGVGARIRSGCRVLVAEDNAVNRLVAGKMLERLGCIVQFAADGEEAVEQVECGTGFDLILMDCQMPRMDGLEATRRIRAGGARTRGIPIVALSAGVLAEERHACYQCGMDEFLAKPLSVEELSKVLAHFLAPV